MPESDSARDRGSAARRDVGTPEGPSRRPEHRWVSAAVEGTTGEREPGQVWFPAKVDLDERGLPRRTAAAAATTPFSFHDAQPTSSLSCSTCTRFCPRSCVSIAARKRPSRLPRTPLARRAGCRSNEFRGEWCDPRNAPNALAGLRRDECLARKRAWEKRKNGAGRCACAAVNRFRLSRFTSAPLPLQLR